MDLINDLWYIKNTHTEDFKKVIDFCKKHSEYNSWSNSHTYYGRFKPGNSINGFDSTKNEYHIFNEIRQLTLDEFLEFTEPFVLPKKYYITKIDHPDYKLICDYFHDKSCSVTNNWSDFNYLYYEKNNNLKGYNACYDTYKIKNCTEVSVEDFVKHVLNKETKMEQKLTRRQLITLFNADSCSKWKEIIIQYVTTFSAFDTDDVTTFIDPTHLDLLFKEGTDKQKKLVTNLGIVLKEDKNAFVKEFEYDETRIISSKLFGNDNVLVICQNSQDRINRPDLRGRAFVVSKDYTVKTYSSEGNNTIIEIVKK